jgi:hypothetical protein
MPLASVILSLRPYLLSIQAYLVRKMIMNPLSLLSRHPIQNASQISSENLQERNLEALDFKNLLTHYEHRIITLEAEYLEEQKRVGINARKLQERGNKINRLKNILGQFQSHHFNYTAQSMHDIGLPRINDISSDDQKIFEDFLKEQTTSIRTIQRQIDLIESWCRQATSGSTSILKTMVRLPKIGRMIKKSEVATREIESKEKLLNHNIERVLEHFRPDYGPRTPQSLSPSILKEPMFDRLAFWFGKIERQITKVAKLKMELKKQNLKIQRMQAWLNKNTLDPVASLQPEIPSLIDLSREKQSNPLYVRLLKFSKLNRKIETYMASTGHLIPKGGKK